MAPLKNHDYCQLHCMALIHLRVGVTARMPFGKHAKVNLEMANSY